MRLRQLEQAMGMVDLQRANPGGTAPSAAPWQGVCFVGAGPGAADLITLRGLQRLQQADVVLFDALSDPALRELAPQARWVDVGKRGFCGSTPQARINTLLVEAALAHPRVVRLKGGDPSLFGRLEEEMQALQAAGVAYEVVPGVTAALAAAAQAARPLTRRGRGRSVALSTAVAADADGSPQLRAARSADTEVFYMAGRQLGALARRLMQAGWSAEAPTLVVSRAGCADALVSAHALADLAAAGLLHAGRPTVVTVGVGAQAAGPRAPARVVSAGLQAPVSIESDT